MVAILLVIILLIPSGALHLLNAHDMCVHVRGRRRSHVIVHNRRDDVANIGLCIPQKVDVRDFIQGVGQIFHEIRLLEHIGVYADSTSPQFHKLQFFRSYDVSVILLVLSFEVIHLRQHTPYILHSLQNCGCSLGC